MRKIRDMRQKKGSKRQSTQNIEWLSQTRNFILYVIQYNSNLDFEI